MAEKGPSYEDSDSDDESWEFITASDINPNFEIVSHDDDLDRFCVSENMSYFKDKIIGQGSNSVVFQGTFGDSGEEIKLAIKRIQFNNKSKAKKAKITIDREKQVLKTIEPTRHSNIVGFYGAYTKENIVYIGMQLCNGTLCDYVKNAHWRKDLKPVNANKCMINGLKFLHSKGIVHRDLKPPNVFILLSEDGHIANVVLGDFGTSKFTEGTFHSMTGVRGTQGYIAPEYYKDICETERSFLTKRSDVFSLGLLFYFVITAGKYPFGRDEVVGQYNIFNGKEPNLEDLGERDHAQKLLLKNMLARNPEDRLITKLVCDHPALWTTAEIMLYFSQISDKFEEIIIPNNKCKETVLENSAIIPGGDWMTRMTNIGKDNLRKYLEKYKLPKCRTPLYSGKENSVRWLLRAIRNTTHHYKKYDVNAQNQLGVYPDDHADLWLTLCPKLLMHVYSILGN